MWAENASDVMLFNAWACRAQHDDWELGFRISFANCSERVTRLPSQGHTNPARGAEMKARTGKVLASTGVS